jgi:hypothetical protein
MNFLKLWALCGLALSALSFTPPALALRCNTYVIDVGLQKAEVFNKCGAPTLQESHVERRILRQRTVTPLNPGGLIIERELEIKVEEWTYNFGPQRFMQLLVFENGRLVNIKDLGYGS